MIALLNGTVDAVSGQTVTLDVNGVGYEIHCSRGCAEKLVPGERARIVIHTDVREDSIRLYGFEDQLEKQVFGFLTLVKGVGAKTAADIVSRVDKRELMRLIAAGDLAGLQSVKGIGRKTAERILVELKDRVAEYAADQRGAESVRPGAAAELEAVAALQALGFPRREAERAVAAAGKELGPEAADTGRMIKEALRFV